jgi:hypothetical protein
MAHLAARILKSGSVFIPNAAVLSVDPVRDALGRGMQRASRTGILRNQAGIVTSGRSSTKYFVYGYDRPGYPDPRVLEVAKARRFMPVIQCHWEGCEARCSRNPFFVLRRADLSGTAQ